jgi:tetratricopeptide (TPR) repeat protein
MRFPTLMLAIVLMVVTTVAHAEDRERACAQFRAGAQHYKLGEYPEALAAFKEAYRNFEDPTILFNVAQCHRLMNAKADALRAYRTYLSEVPQASNRDEVKRLIASLEEALQKEKETESKPPTEVLSQGRSRRRRPPASRRTPTERYRPGFRARRRSTRSGGFGQRSSVRPRWWRSVSGWVWG